jgi:predicted esterase
VLLLLHGTGGDETFLLRIGELLASAIARLSPHGEVLENGLPRFFCRFEPVIIDIDVLTFRTHELAEFVPSAAGR